MGDVRITAKSTLSTLNRWIEVISGNLVGANIYGFKGTRLSFGDTLVDTLRTGTGSSAIGGLNPIQLPSGGITIGGTSTDFRQGSLVQTGDNNHLAIQGTAFFATVDSAGTIQYTRNGEFHFDDAGNFVDGSGNYVLGVFDQTKAANPPDNTEASVDFLDTTPSVANGVKTSTGASTLALPGMSNVVNATGGINIWTNANSTFLSMVDKTTTVPSLDRFYPPALIPAGQMSLGGSATGVGSFMTITPAGGTVAQNIPITLTAQNNTPSNTAYDNAKLIADAINAQSRNTGVGASIIRDKSDPNGTVAIVMGHIERTLTEDYVAGLSPNAGSIGNAGIVETITDKQDNTFYRINIKTLTSAFPGFRPEAGDKFSWDGTGQLINTSRGKDANAAPPVSYGIHVALNKFPNSDGLQKVKGSSNFAYSDAAGQIISGYAGMSKSRRINLNYGVEEDGTSVIGAENTVIPQSLEASNTSITEMLPELTIAQKTFTSNTKVISVGNTIVDDLNQIIR